jgi:hypothetical protein
MSDPWFDPNLFAWIPGTLLGVAGGVWGGLAGWLAPRGRAKRLILGGMAVLLAYSAICLLLGVAALACSQPYGIWYGFGLAGLIGLTAIGFNVIPVRRYYRAAERREMAARDLG